MPRISYWPIIMVATALTLAVIIMAVLAWIL